MFSRLLTPKWVLLHLLVAVLFVATFFLGYWQLTKAEAGGGAVNWSYALQWPLYGFMGLWFYLRMVRIELHRDPDDDEPGAAVVLYQRPRIDTTGDPELAAYNAYLAELNEKALGQTEQHPWPLTRPRRRTTPSVRAGIAAACLRYRVMANVVGVLLIALVLVAMPLKYFADMPGPVAVLGTAHGFLYAAVPARRLRPGAAGQVDRQGHGARAAGRHHPLPVASSPSAWSPGRPAPASASDPTRPGFPSSGGRPTPRTCA